MNNKRITLLGVLATLAFMGALLLSMSSEPERSPDREVPTSTYSYSLLGHRGIYETLAALSVPTTSSQFSSMARACGSLLILAEPDDDNTDLSAMLGELGCPKAVLLVLPKWQAKTDARGFVMEPEQRDKSAAKEILESLSLDATLTTLSSAATWKASNFAFAVPTAQVTNLQLLSENDGLIPQISTEFGGTLLAVHADHPNLYILSDPDFINNAGLQAGHAAFAVGLLTQLASTSGIVFDETIHGYDRPPAIWKSLFAFPLSLLAAHLVVVLLVLLWAFAKNASNPPDEPAREGGYRYLVRNTASLLTASSHRRNILQRYLEACRTYVNDKLGRATPMQTSELEAREVSKRVSRSLASIASHIQTASDKQLEHEFLQLAAATHTWRQEMTEEISREP